MQSQFLCPNCANPFTPPPLLDSFVFAVDLEPTMDLFEGRLNTTTCPLCKARVSVLTAVIVTNHDEHAILGTLPEGADPAEEEQLVLLAAQHGYSLKIFRNYNELGQAALGWINPYIVPGLSQLLSDEIDQLPLEEKVGLATPFLLRVLKASLDGYLPPVLGFSGGSPEETSGMAEELYRSLLTDHLGNLRKLAVAQNRLPDLPSLIDEHVPRVCLAAPVLGALVDRCGPPIDPESNPQDFVRAYMDEYLCAAAHACAGVPNPRGSAFAIYLARCWRLSRRDDVVFDDRLLLSNAVIHRVLRFEDLWDAVTYRPPDNPLSPEEMKEILPLLDAFGYQQETNRLLGAGIITIPNAGELSPQTKEQLKDVLLETLFTDVAFSRSPEESEGIGVMVAGLVTHLLRNQLQEQTFSALDEVLQRAKAADDPVAVVSICASTIAVLCQNLLYGQASALAGEALKFVSDIRVTARPALCIQIWNEMGNVARYRRQRQAALESYQFAQEMNEIAPLDDEERARNRLTLRRNIAIIYRELGEYRRALELLRSASAAAPEDGGLLHNLAALYLDLNRYDDALGYLDRAVALAPAPVRALERARYLFSRSQVRLALGKAEAGLHDLQEAYQCIPADNRSFRGALAAAALSFYPRSPAGQQFVAECQSLVQELITEGDMDAAPEAPYLRGSLCARLLRDGQVATAGTILDPLWERIQAEDAGYDWRLAYIRGWLEYARHRDARCWPLLVEAGSKIDLAVPIGANVQFAPFWLQDKGEFQDLLVAVALDLVGRGQLPAAELLGVYELMNGREISARLAGEDAPGTQTGSAILDRCARHPRAQERNLTVFFFVETAHEARLACLDARAGTVGLVNLPPIDLRELQDLKPALSLAFKRANPVALAGLDQKLAPWEDLARRLGAAVAGHLQPGAHACFLPGRAFTGLPLHLLAMPDGRRLVEWGAASLAPNFTVLLDAGARPPAEAGAGLAIVVVTRAGDSAAFRQNALQAAQDLRAVLEPHTPARLLQDQQADRAAVQAALTEAGEVLFLCHGTTAGQHRGYGICIAAHGLLPPNNLSVREVLEHVDFILNWEDIEQSPPTFVSIACSSGITELAKGGVRFGLEQTLFSSGTRHIISPLWDVSQESALYWVRAFYAAKQAEPTCSIEDAYRHACLATRHQYPHLYHWGPFVANGAL